jgi:hypothetical protein
MEEDISEEKSMSILAVRDLERQRQRRNAILSFIRTKIVAHLVCSRHLMWTSMFRQR